MEPIPLWSEITEIRGLLATAEDVSAYLENRAAAGARASTIRVPTAAIAHNHRDAVSASIVLDELTHRQNRQRCAEQSF